MLVDLTAGGTGTTTGCAFGTPALGEDLFATTFFNRSVVRFASEAPHAATSMPLRPGDAPPDIEAVESIAFDNAGNYYLGAMVPGPQAAGDTPPAFGYILKFDGNHRLLTTYEVPNENRGADQIDVGPDQKTLYYTSQGTSIHAFNPDLPAAERYRRIQITDDGASLAGYAYALRVLPPAPGRTEPSGFLVATTTGVLRVAPDGRVIRRYRADGVPASYYSLSLTPDGQSFWTATFQDDPDWKDYCPGGQFFDPADAGFDPSYCATYDVTTGGYTLPPPSPGGALVRFHIPSGSMTAGPNIVADNVWGLCSKREYTAARNVCYETDEAGSALLDASGTPIVVACRVPEYCGNAIDEDGDSLPDSSDPDCAPRGSLPPLPPYVSNSAPVAMPDTATALGSSLVPMNVMANDMDPDGDSISILPGGFTQPDHGSVKLDASSRFLYSAPLGFSGPASFTYTITDGQAASTATATITVLPARVCYAGRKSSRVSATLDWWESVPGFYTVRATVRRGKDANSYDLTVKAASFADGSAYRWLLELRAGESLVSVPCGAVPASPAAGHGSDKTKKSHDGDRRRHDRER